MISSHVMARREGEAVDGDVPDVDGLVAAPKNVPESPTTKVVSRFFSTNTASSPSAAHSARLPSDGPNGKRVSIPARLPDAARQAARALEEFRVTARKKNAHTEHSNAAEAVLIPFRPFALAKQAADKAEADGDVLCVDVKSVAGANGSVLENNRMLSFPSTSEGGVVDAGTISTAYTTVGTAVQAQVRAPHQIPGTSDAGVVLRNTLQELDRLHVNASCRVRQRAPAVAEARARLTSLRRECRDMFKLLDRQGFDDANKQKLFEKQSLPAARDAKEFSKLGAGSDIAEIRHRCSVFRSTGSPHHLCLHLCYYREYDPVRRLFVLRTRLAAETGSATALDGWRAGWRAATGAEMGLDENNFDDDVTEGQLDDDDHNDALDGFDASPASTPGPTPTKSPTTKKPKPKRKRKRAEDSASGWLSGNNLPWRVVFTSPDGFTFKHGAEVLRELGLIEGVGGVGGNRSIIAATDNGGGGLGNETLEDFDGQETQPDPRRDPVGHRMDGRVPPPRRRAALNLGVGGSHGGSGVRLARPDERGLDAACDVLRAALWPTEFDDSVGTSPTRDRLALCKQGGPRSPVRLAPEYDQDETNYEAHDDDAYGGLRQDAYGMLHGQSASAQSTHNQSVTPQTQRWWSPPRSPFGLLEEILWEDEWKMLVACMMLNCTTRLQVDRVLWRLFLAAGSAKEAVLLGRHGIVSRADQGAGTSLTPTPGTAVTLHDSDSSQLDPDGFSVSGMRLLESILAPLGLHRKRARAFVKLSEDYLKASQSSSGVGTVGTSSQTERHTNNPTRIATPVSQLHGVGAYASDAHTLFCEGTLGVAPRDHALRWWYAWAIERREGERREAAERRRGA